MEFDEDSLITKITKVVKLENMSLEDLDSYIDDLKRLISKAELEIKIKKEAIKGAKDIFKKN
ncbi:MAG: hypothetical protein CMM67_06560 [Rhodospirillaceae bacterium]|nr:hypothetical protein [Rhodospirillaceae bacterium]OUT78252.1 MAG: hypothetical protein CBB83_06745 [Rhodospirillaceae bacterium TMED23]